MPSKKGPRMFANLFCKVCGFKIGVTQFNKKNHSASDIIENGKITKKFCSQCRSHQPAKIKELKN